MQTGENEQGLRKIIDLTRLISLVILIIHYYISCHEAFVQWKLTNEILHSVLLNIVKLGIFKTTINAKCASLLTLLVSLIGAKGKKSKDINIVIPISYCLAGVSFYFLSLFIFNTKLSLDAVAVFYISLSSIGYLLILSGGTRISRIIHLKFDRDVFNTLNETFPQEERLLENEFSINLPTLYQLKGKIRKAFINIINPFRALLVIGTPGAGKSYFIIRHIITQHIKKGFTMFLYDFKFDDLSKIAYNTLLRYKNKFEVVPKFYVINFDKVYHRCNPLEPSMMFDITDASESSRTIMLGLNREWIKRQGDFFVESPINFVTAVIWFLRKYNDGRYCTLPHVIELMQTNYDQLFSVLRTQAEIEVLINPFVSAFLNNAMEQLEGQIASAKICMARLSSPMLYYVLSGNDFTLDVNNPNDPKIVCVGNNPQKQQIYSAVLSLYISRVIRILNRKNQQKCSLVFDEFPTAYFNGIDTFMATARANLVATTLAVQDYSQLKKDYGRDQAEVILNLAGNIISGQAAGDTAKFLSERFGKIVQQRESISINSNDTSISRSTQLDSAIPPSKIATLSSGEFVGIVSDNPDQKINLKVFHSEIVNDHKGIKAEEKRYKEIPVVRKVANNEVRENYLKIKSDVRNIIKNEINRIKTDPQLSHLLIVKG